MIGPGKYGTIATAVRAGTAARGVIVMVFDGDLGSGFSCQLTPDLAAIVPVILRQMAERIEADRAKIAAQEQARTS